MNFRKQYIAFCFDMCVHMMAFILDLFTTILLFAKSVDHLDFYYFFFLLLPTDKCTDKKIKKKPWSTFPEVLNLTEGCWTEILGLDAIALNICFKNNFVALLCR